MGRHVQERAGQLQEKHREVRERAEIAEHEAERLQHELCSERTARTQLEDETLLLRATVERADRGREAARDALAKATSQQADLESSITACHREAEVARAGVQQVEQQLLVQIEQSEALRAAAMCFTGSLRRCIDRWACSLNDDGLNGSSSGCTHAPAHGCAAIARASVAADASIKPCATAAGPLATLIGLRSQALFDAGSPPGASSPPRVDAVAGHGDPVCRRDEPPLPPPSQSPPMEEDNVAPEVPQAMPSHVPAGGVAHMLSFIVGDQDSPLPPPAPPWSPPKRGVGLAAGAMAVTATEMAVAEASMAARAKRSVTQSVLVMPGIEPAFKRPRPAWAC